LVIAIFLPEGGSELAAKKQNNLTQYHSAACKQLPPAAVTDGSTTKVPAETTSPLEASEQPGYLTVVESKF